MEGQKLIGSKSANREPLTSPKDIKISFSKVRAVG
jgi:hypothetical protein